MHLEFNFKVFLFALCMLFLPFGHSLPVQKIEYTPHHNVLEKWMGMETAVKGGVKFLVKNAMPTVIRTAMRLNLSQTCMNEGLQVINGIMKLKPWAFRFIDSSAKSIDGVLGGTLTSLGSYDECIETEVRTSRNRDGKLSFRGQYCSIEIKPPLPPQNKLYKFGDVLDDLKNFSKADNIVSDLAKIAHLFYFLSLRVGICVPSGCTAHDISKLVREGGKFVLMDVNVSRCEVMEENKFTTEIIIALFFYGFMGFLALACTSTEVYFRYKNKVPTSKAYSHMMSFSLLRNFKKLFSIEEKTTKFHCLNGMRFFTITWVMLGHTYYIFNYQLFTDLLKAQVMTKGFAFQVIANGGLAVETFFVIGGLLVSYSVLKAADEGQQLNAVVYIFHRFWRIGPLLVFSILGLYLFNLSSSGPVWSETVSKYVEPCYYYWWRNLIFLNNFFDQNEACMQHTWYLACDFQLYVGALIILLPLTRWPRVGINLSILGILASIFYSGFVIYYYDVSPTALAADPDPRYLENYFIYFFKPFVHIGPYCIGILSGYILARKPDLKISKKYQVIGWCMAIIFNLSAVYGVYEWNRGVEPRFWDKIFYAALHRNAWCLGIAWVIISCVTGNGGFVNTILSCKVFVPLGRLTFFVYLFHPFPQLIYAASLRTLTSPSHFILTWLFLAHVVVTFAVAFVGSVMLESPFLALEKVILSSMKNTHKRHDLENKETSTNGTLQLQKIKKIENCNFN